MRIIYSLAFVIEVLASVLFSKMSLAQSHPRYWPRGKKAEDFLCTSKGLRLAAQPPLYTASAQLANIFTACKLSTEYRPATAQGYQYYSKDRRSGLITYIYQYKDSATCARAYVHLNTLLEACARAKCSCKQEAPQQLFRNLYFAHNQHILVLFDYSQIGENLPEFIDIAEGYTKLLK